MTLKIVIMFTIFSIIGEYKGVQGDIRIQEISFLYRLAYHFNVDAFAELNLLCYNIMHLNVVAKIIQVEQDNPKETPLTQDDIELMAATLYLLKDWAKFLDDTLLKEKDTCYNNTECTYNQLKDAAPEIIKSFSNENTFKPTFKTPIGWKYIVHNSNQDYQIFLGNKLQFVSNFCNETLNALSTKTAIFNSIRKSDYGYIVLLMTEVENTVFRTGLTEEFVIIVIKNALVEIVFGISYLLDNINDVSLINKTLLLMIYNVMTDNVVLLSEKLDKMSLYKDKTSGSSIYNTQKYVIFIQYLKQKWQNTLIQLFPGKLPTSVLLDQLPTSVFSVLLDQLPTSGRLITDNKVQPSIIRYYAAYMESLEKTDILNYDGTDKDKLLFVMELYAWTKILDQQLIELPIFKAMSNTPDMKPEDTDYKKLKTEIQNLWKTANSIV